jgi:hypothetical protein
MYSVSEIKSGLIGLIGWRQNVDITGVQLTDLTTTTSGLYFNDEHPLLTFDNLLSIAPQFDRLNDATNTNRNTRFTTWLKDRTEAGIIRAIDRWQNEKAKLRTAGNLLANNVVFKNTSNIADLDTDNGKIVGHVIDIIPSNNLRVTIESLALQLTEDQDLVISLYETGNSSAIKSETFSYTGSGSVQWFTPATVWELDGNKTYYLIYDQADLTGQSVNSIYGQTSEFTGDCAKYTRFTSFETESFTPAILTGAYSVGNGTNYGLNYKLSVKCDYTDFILEQKDLFKTIISKQIAIDLLREMAHNANVRENRNSSNVDFSRVMYEIDGDSTGVKKSGLEMQLQRALDAIQFDYTNVDTLCLPCRKRGVKYRTV